MPSLGTGLKKTSLPLPSTPTVVSFTGAKRATAKLSQGGGDAGGGEGGAGGAEGGALETRMALARAQNSRLASQSVLTPAERANGFPTPDVVLDMCMSVHDDVSLLSAGLVDEPDRGSLVHRKKELELDALRDETRQLELALLSKAAVPSRICSRSRKTEVCGATICTSNAVTP